MNIRLIFFIILAIFVCCVNADTFKSNWQKTFDRVWIGLQYWSNPLQDWRIDNGELECITSAPNRNVHLLTHQLSSIKLLTGKLVLELEFAEILMIIAIAFLPDYPVRQLKELM